jgi:hypothetical protein
MEPTHNVTEQAIHFIVIDRYVTTSSRAHEALKVDRLMSGYRLA